MVVHSALEEICRQLGDRVEFNPIKAGESAGPFVFQESPRGNILVSYADNGNHYSEFDDLLVVDDLPVLFEVKLGGKRYKGKKRYIPSKDGQLINQSNLGVGHSIGMERIDHLLAPLKEYFTCSDCGYVLVTDPEVVEQNSQSARTLFEENNGMYVPFYTSKINFRLEILRLKHRHGLYFN